MFGIGFSEFLVFAVISLIILGPEKLPEAARTAGKWYAYFRSQANAIQNEISRTIDQPDIKQHFEQAKQQLNELNQNFSSTLNSSLIVDGMFAGSTTKVKHQSGYHYWYWLTGAEQQLKCPSVPFVWQTQLAQPFQEFYLDPKELHPKELNAKDLDSKDLHPKELNAKEKGELS